MAEITAYDKIQDLTPSFEYTPQDIGTLFTIEKAKADKADELISTASKALLEFDNIKVLDVISDPGTGFQTRVGDKSTILGLRDQYAKDLTSSVEAFRAGRIQPYEFATKINKIKSEVSAIRNTPFVLNAEASYKQHNDAVELYNKDIAGKITGSDDVGLNFTKNAIRYAAAGGAKSGTFGSTAFFKEINPTEANNKLFDGLKENIINRSGNLRTQLSLGKIKVDDAEYVRLVDQAIQGTTPETIKFIFDQSWNTSDTRTYVLRNAESRVLRAVMSGGSIQAGNKTFDFSNPDLTNDQQSVLREQARIALANEMKDGLMNQAIAKLSSSKLQQSQSLTSIPKSDDEGLGKSGFMGTVATQGVPNPNTDVANSFMLRNGTVVSTTDKVGFAQGFNDMWNQLTEKEKTMKNVPAFDKAVGSTIFKPIISFFEGVKSGAKSFTNDDKQKFTREQSEFYNNQRETVLREQPKLLEELRSAKSSGKAIKDVERKIEEATFQKIESAKNSMSLFLDIPTPKNWEVMQQVYSTNGTKGSQLVTQASIINPETGKPMNGKTYLSDVLGIEEGDEEYEKQIKEIRYNGQLAVDNPYGAQIQSYSYRGKTFFVDDSFNATPDRKIQHTIVKSKLGKPSEVNVPLTDGSVATFTYRYNSTKDVVEQDDKVIITRPDGSFVEQSAKVLLTKQRK